MRCSSGTYIRALARDMGEALGVGGRLTRLRRTRVGPYGLAAAHTLDELAPTQLERRCCRWPRPPRRRSRRGS